jgi:hypothetical protein
VNQSRYFTIAKKHEHSSSRYARCRPHTTSPDLRLSGHRVSDLCNHPRSSTPGLLLLPRSSSLPTMPHLPLAHHETSKHDSSNRTKINVKQLKCPGFKLKPQQVIDSSQSNQVGDHLVSHKLNVRQCRPEVQERANHAHVLSLVNSLAIFIWTQRNSRAHWSRHGLELSHVELLY